MRRLTLKDIKRELRGINRTIKVLSDYVHSQAPLTCLCLVCKNVWKPTWSNLSQGAGCPKCSLVSFRLTDYEVRKRLKKVNPTVTLMEKYKGAMVRVKCKCLSCGNVWKVMWASLNSGYGCPECGKKKVRNALKLTSKEIRLRLRKINPTIKVVGEYTNSSTALPCFCKVCGYKWSPVWQSLSQGVGCPKCGKVARKRKQSFTLSKVKILLHKVNPNITLLSTKYENSRTHLVCKCKKCGASWKVNWDNLNQGHGCPHCSCKSESEIRSIFEKLTGMEFPKANPSDVPWLHGLHLDGYCSSLKSSDYPNGVAFEYQGIQHYLPHWKDKTKTELLERKKNDRRKRIQCWRHNVKLVCVPCKVRNIESFVIGRLQKAGFCAFLKSKAKSNEKNKSGE